MIYTRLFLVRHFRFVQALLQLCQFILQRSNLLLAFLPDGIFFLSRRLELFNLQDAQEREEVI